MHLVEEPEIVDLSTKAFYTVQYLRIGSHNDQLLDHLEGGHCTRLRLSTITLVYRITHARHISTQAHSGHRRQSCTNLTRDLLPDADVHDRRYHKTWFTQKNKEKALYLTLPLDLEYPRLRIRCCSLPC